MKTINEHSLFHGFIDSQKFQKGLFTPRLINNNNLTSDNLKNTLRELLTNCESYWINVAFITNSGLAQIRGILVELDERKINGKIIISSYQYFSEPIAIKNLFKLKYAEIRLAENIDSHAKGYIFKTRDFYDIIIGSSNLTVNALTQNNEWNIQLCSAKNGSIKNEIFTHFEYSWNNSTPISDSIINKYENAYIRNQSKKPILQSSSPDYPIVVTPNSMQIKALNKLYQLRTNRAKRALIISATGTGKTYLAAFDVQKVKPKRMLFVVHRLSIAKKAMSTFRNLIGDKYSMGLYSGNQLNIDADYVFSTIQTISRNEHLENFKPETFEYIIIDETHRSGAYSYQKIIDYFKPHFMLGMTATPERTDNYDIFSLFDNNIAAEIRLNEAMSENLLCDFHYYGVSDLNLDFNKVKKLSQFNKIDYQTQSEKIIEKAQYYGVDNENVRGLIFCSSIEHCHGINNELNTKGYNTRVIDANVSQEDRDLYFDLIESDGADKIDYLISYDVLNEGIDLPRINQVILLRPTQSAIVFVQQLGRGLRKSEGKEFLTVIDFIGNYRENNFLIPVALFGDRTFNKDNLRRVMVSIDKYTPKNCSINFDRVSKERIFASIDTANLNSKKLIDADYKYLKRKLGKGPNMMDFVNHGERDPYTIVRSYKSFALLLSKVDPDRIELLNERQLTVLSYLNREINNGKRYTESLILSKLLNESDVNIDSIIEEHIALNLQANEIDIQSAISNLNFEFNNNNYKISLKLIHQENGKITFSSEFQDWLNNDQFRELVLDNTEFGLRYFLTKRNSEKSVIGFHLHSKYDRKDFSRVANLKKNEEAVIFGYKQYSHCIPLFVTLRKDMNISKATQYEDYFINEKEFHWMSKHSRNLRSKDITEFINNDYSKRPVLLFVQKSNKENDFYFLGRVHPASKSNNFTETTIDNKSVVSIQWTLEDECPKDLYQYFNSNIQEAD